MFKVKLSVLALLASGLLSSSAFAAPVELVSEFNITMSKYGFTWYGEDFVVAVDKLAGNKTVYIHRQKKDGTWVSIPMRYAGPSGNNKELWSLNNSVVGGEQFAVKYSVNGVDYWDNNNGQNYKIKDAGYLLGGTKVVAMGSYGISNDNSGTNKLFNGTVAVKNIGLTKKVKLIYTTDNWATSTVVNGTFSGNPVYYGYGSYANPNANGFESWNLNFQFPANKTALFYIEYEVNGQKFYDNNYTANYKLNPATTYGSMNVRTGPNWSSGLSMTAIDNNLWATDISIGTSNNPTAFKFDVKNDWTTNFGDNNADGIAEFNGNNIPLSSQVGQYQILFNDATKAYSVRKFGL